jgi:HK97 family phage portal protein
VSIVRALKPRHEPERSTAAWSEFGPWAAQILPHLGGFTTANTTERALRNAASWACIHVLADAFSRTPVDALRKKSDGTSEDVEPEPQLIAKPSNLTTATAWRYQAATSVLTAGNAYGLVTAWKGVYPTQVELLDPARVTGCVENGKKQIRVDAIDHAVWEDGGDAVHIPGKYMFAGSPFGRSPLETASQVTGMSLAAEDFSNRFFTDGGHPTQAIAADRDLSPEEATGIKAAFMRIFGNGSREPFVHGSGLTLSQIQSDPQAAGTLDLVNHALLQCCRFWQVPPSMVYAAVAGQNVTYANVTDADLMFLKNSLDSYFVRFEDALTELIPRPQYVKFNRDAVLRADPMRRHEIYDKRLRNRSMTINEVRGLEDEPPFPEAEFDVAGIPGGAESTKPTPVPPPAAVPGEPTKPPSPGSIQPGKVPGA